MEDNGSNGMCKACAASNGTVSKDSPEEASVGDISETVDIKKETEIEDEFEDNFESDNLEYDADADDQVEEHVDMQTPFAKQCQELVSSLSKKCNLRCDKCDRTFTERGSLNHHVANEHGPLDVDSFDSDNFEYVDKLDSPKSAFGKQCQSLIKSLGGGRKSVKPTLKCDDCEETFVNIGTLCHHMVNKHEKSDSSSRRRRQVSFAEQCLALAKTSGGGDDAKQVGIVNGQVIRFDDSGPDS